MVFYKFSYGVKFPVPEKRKKRFVNMLLQSLLFFKNDSMYLFLRLLQEFNDIEKNIRKKR